MSNQINLKNINFRNSHSSLFNVNLNIDNDNHIIIKTVNQYDYESATALLKIIFGKLKPSSGYVDYNFDNDKRMNITYNNFYSIFEKHITVDEFLSTLLKIQKTNHIQQFYNELVSMLGIDVNKYCDEMTSNELSSLNLLCLLMVKPKFILLDSIVLKGSNIFQIAIFKYIKEYCDSNKITIISISNNENAISVLGDRVIKISNGKIVEDTTNKHKVERLDNFIDNKTKKFDLEDDILEALNVGENKNFNKNKSFNNNKNNYHEKPNSFNNNKPNQTKKFINQDNSYSKIKESKHIDNDLMMNITKALDFDFESELEDDFNKAKNNTKNLNNESKSLNLTEELLETTDEYEVTTQKFDDEIKQRTININNESNDLLNDIYQSKHNTDFKQEETKPKGNVTTEFLNDVRDTYNMRNALQEQVKSPDFSKLNIDLQRKVYENLDAANALIKEVDPDGEYDPNKSYSQNIANQNNSVTRMIINEELKNADNNDEEDDWRTGEIISTSKITDEFLYSTKEERNIVDNINTQDFNYYDNEKRSNSNRSWKDRFLRRDHNKQTNKKATQEIFGNNNSNFRDSFEPKKDYQEDMFEDYEIGLDTNNITTGNNFGEQEKVNNNATTAFEPMSSLKPQKTEVLIPTKKFKTNYFDPSLSEQENIERTKKLKTMAIKKRSKKNFIEKLYDEAKEDSEIIEGYKEKYSK